jgi:hypothetical protein
MTTAARAGLAGPVKMNTRMSDLADIPGSDHPLVGRTIALIDKLRARELTVDAFQDAIKALHEELDLPRALKPWIERTLAERKDQVLYRRTVPASRETIQLFYIEPYEVHPPHSHHNAVSTQMVLHGRVHIREFDRIARLGPDTVLMKRRTDAWFGVGGAMRTTEVDANAHWFAAGETPAVMLNFNIYGYQSWTFDPKNDPFRRKLIDPTYGVTPDGLIVAREIDVAEAYAKFGGRKLTDFPLP